MDVLATESHIEELDGALRAILAELKEQEDVIDRYEAEERRRNDVIAKKQTEVDRLNKRLDQLKVRRPCRCRLGLNEG